MLPLHRPVPTPRREGPPADVDDVVHDCDARITADRHSRRRAQICHRGVDVRVPPASDVVAHHRPVAASRPDGRSVRRRHVRRRPDGTDPDRRADAPKKSPSSLFERH
ncbi:hypothetical protein [Halomicrococcus sp. NG-SE-24]|uniref:hypothetical protein n=1 Tax=Halomicrococcus sp. NG-SE-24 TaxID=3436928 RepID=UPI003D96763C